MSEVLPEEMTCIRCSGQGDPREVVHVERVPLPTVGAGDALIRMQAAPVHNIDLYRFAGRWRHRSMVAEIPGYEGIGTVAAIGSEVDGLDIGDRVFPPMGCGTWREYLAVPAAGVRRAPSGDAAQLSLLGINPPSAWLLLRRMVPLARGDWFVQNAANSSCGQYLIELARHWGLRSVNVVRRDSAVAGLRELGGDVVLVDGPDLGARVAAATGGAEIRLGIDAVNGTATTRLADCLANGGVIAVYGMLSEAPCELPGDYLFVRDINLRGFLTTRELATMAGDEIRAMQAEVVSLVADGVLHADIAGEYPLAEVHAALEHAARTGDARQGKVILRM